MTLVISPELQRLIEQRMQRGKYASAQDVVAAALHALDQDERVAEFAGGELEGLLDEGERSGPALDGEQVLSELRNLREGRRQ